MLLLARVGHLAAPLPSWMLRAGTRGLAAVFAMTANNLVQPQDAYARELHVYFFGPLLLILAALCATAARSRPRR